MHDKDIREGHRSGNGPVTILNIHSTTCRSFSCARKAEDIVSGLSFGIHQAQKAIATASGY